MRLRPFLFALAFLISLGACGTERPTLIAGDSNDAESIADDSAPIELVPGPDAQIPASPTTTTSIAPETTVVVVDAVSRELSAPCVQSESEIADYGSPITSGAPSAAEVFDTFVSEQNNQWTLRTDWQALTLGAIDESASSARAFYVNENSETYLIVNAEHRDGFWIEVGYSSCHPG